MSNVLPLCFSDLVCSLILRTLHFGINQPFNSILKSIQSIKLQQRSKKYKGRKLYIDLTYAMQTVILKYWNANEKFSNVWRNFDTVLRMYCKVFHNLCLTFDFSFLL